MKDFRQIRLDESNELVENTNSLISEQVQDITEALSIIAQRIADEEISNRLVEIAEELGLYNKYFTISESCILNEYDSGLLPAIAESYRTGDSFEYTYPDGEVVEIDADLSESIVDIYDNLDEENRNIFAALVSESADNLEDVLNHFAEDEEDEDDLNEGRLAGQRADEKRPEKVDDTPDDNLAPKQGLKIARDRKAYIARKAAEAEAKRKSLGGLKKEDLEGDTNTISEKPMYDGDRPSKKSGPSTRDLAKQARWLKKTGIDKNASVKNKKGC